MKGHTEVALLLLAHYKQQLHLQFLHLNETGKGKYGNFTKKDFDRELQAIVNLRNEVIVAIIIETIYIYTIIINVDIIGNRSAEALYIVVVLKAIQRQLRY